MGRHTMAESNRELREKIINKIRKLSELANSDNNAFEAEMQAASSKIQELMEAYSLTWSEIENSNKEKDKANLEEMKSEIFIERRTSWHNALSQAIALITHTKCFFSGDIIRNKDGYASRAWRTTFFGEAGGALAAVFLYDKWSLVLCKMAIKATGDYEIEQKSHENYFRPKPTKKQLNLYMTSWLYGCAKAILDNAKERNQEVKENGLMIYDKNIEQAYRNRYEGRMRQAKGTNDVTSAQGYESGAREGRNININQSEFERKNGQIAKKPNLIS